MFSKFSTLTALTLIIAAPSFAQEPPVEEEVSSYAKINEVELQGRKAINNEINRWINNDSEGDLKELVRNANALKRIDNPNAKDVKVDVKNKEEMRKFIKGHIGMSDNIIPEEELKITPEKVETPYDKLKRARKGLQ